MGLDTMIERLVKVNTKKTWTDDEIEELYPDCSLDILEPDKDPQDISLAPGFPKDYVFKCKVMLIDYDKWLESMSTPERPVKYRDWSWSMEGTCPALKENEVPGCTWYISFHKKGTEGEKWSKDNVIDLPVCIDGKSEYPFQHKEVLDCVLRDCSELGYCRKSFNALGCQKFYKDMEAGKPCFLFLEKDVEEYGKKYFNDDFKAAIVEKFVEGDGRYVFFYY